MTLTVGQRVRTLIDLKSAEWHPEQPDIPVGALGTVDTVHRSPSGIAGYGVLFDDDVHQLPAFMDPAHIEATRR